MAASSPMQQRDSRLGPGLPEGPPGLASEGSSGLPENAAAAAGPSRGTAPAEGNSSVSGGSKVPQREDSDPDRIQDTLRSGADNEVACDGDTSGSATTATPTRGMLADDCPGGPTGSPPRSPRHEDAQRDSNPSQSSWPRPDLAERGHSETISPSGWPWGEAHLRALVLAPVHSGSAPAPSVGATAAGAFSEAACDDTDTTGHGGPTRRRAAAHAQAVLTSEPDAPVTQVAPGRAPVRGHGAALAVTIQQGQGFEAHVASESTTFAGAQAMAQPVPHRDLPVSVDRALLRTVTASFGEPGVCAADLIASVAAPAGGFLTLGELGTVVSALAERVVPAEAFRFYVVDPTRGEALCVAEQPPTRESSRLRVRLGEGIEGAAAGVRVTIESNSSLSSRPTGSSGATRVTLRVPVVVTVQLALQVAEASLLPATGSVVSAAVAAVTTTVTAAHGASPSQPVLKGPATSAGHGAQAAQTTPAAWAGTQVAATVPSATSLLALLEFTRQGTAADVLGFSGNDTRKALAFAAELAPALFPLQSLRVPPLHGHTSLVDIESMKVPVFTTGGTPPSRNVVLTYHPMAAATSPGLAIRTPPAEPRNAADHRHDNSPGNNDGSSPSTAVASATAAETVPWPASASASAAAKRGGSKVML